jgi:gliding motility-associated-like protein
MPYFFYATSMAGPLSHKADNNAYKPADQRSSISSKAYSVSDQSGSNTLFPVAFPPSITCHSNIKTVSDFGECGGVVYNLKAVYNDPDDNVVKLTWAITGVTVANSPLTGINNLSNYPFNIGVSTITYIVTDADNLSATCNFTVEVTDAEIPDITSCPNDTVITIPFCDLQTATVTLPTQPVATDNCGVLSIFSNAPSQFPVGNNIVVWTVTDINGNLNQCEQLVTVKNAPAMTLAGSSTPVSCFGGNNGTATAIVSNGVSPYTYSWNTVPVQTTLTASNLTAGVYTLTVTDKNNCTASTSVTVTQPAAALALSVTSKTDVNCFGGSTGSVTVAGNGGTPAYQYSINGVLFQASPTFPNLAAGTYTLTVKDSRNCLSTTDVTITQPASAVAGEITGQTNVACFGAATGSVTVAGSGGTPPYQYNIDGGAFQASGTFNSLLSGSHIVIVKDAKNCQFNVPVTITAPVAPLSASISGQTNVLCAGQTTGSATVTASGGTPPYTYSWNTIPVQSAATATNLKAGSYTVTVTDAAGCIKTANVTITEPAPIVVSITKKDVACKGDLTGSATALANGGTQPYTYAWSTTPVQSTATASNLAAGNYTVTVTDLSGCIKTGSVTITEPATKFTASITNQVNVLCAGNNTGSITVAGSGGTPSYQYNINGGAFQAGGTFNNLTAGAYTIIAKDFNDCQVIIPATITEPAAPLTALITNQTNVLCASQTTGSATVTANGGTPSYTYSWNSTPVQSTATAINLKAGSYTVTVTDAAGCTKTASVTITEPAPIVVTITKKDVACKGDLTGSATASVSGGTQPYTYSWSTTPVQSTATASNLLAGIYTVTVTDSSGCTKSGSVTILEPATKFTASITNQVNVLCGGSNTGSITVAGSGGTPAYQYNINGGAFQASGTFNNLTAGAYTIIAKDANDCQVVIPATITEPADPLTALVSSQTNVFCAGQATGSATVMASGGTPPYEYSWNTTPVQSTETVANLQAGGYIVTVTDAAGCTKTANVTITEPAPLVITITKKDVACKGDLTGSATASASGGIPPYIYAWLTSPIQSTATISNLAPGTYSVAVFDSAGCFKSGSVTISEPDTKFTASITDQVNVLCASSTTGSITVAGSGGTSPYQYNINGGAFQAGGTFNNLTAGPHTIIAKDANDCQVIISATITSPPNGITASITSQTNVPCAGETNGSATVTASGGTSPYTYSWNTSPVQTTASITNLAAGTYIVTSTDNAGCFVLDTAIITEPLKLKASITNQVNFDCVTGTNGSVTVAGADGTPGYRYSLDGGAYQAGGNFMNLAPGNYLVTVQDTNNCKVDVPFEITVPGLIMAVNDTITTPEDTPSDANVMTNDQVICYQPIVVTANTVPQHGTVNMNSNGSFTYTPSLNYNGTDSFTYTITDNKGGVSTATVSIQVDAVNDPPVAVEDSDTTNYEAAVTINVLNNDSDTENGILTVSVCDPPLNGELLLNNDGSITYTPNSDFSGNDQFCYTICDDGTPSRCDSAMVYIRVIPKPRVEDVFVYNGFSPNGDNNNDHLVIRGIEDFPDNEIEFFNRYGDKIKKLSHYDNHNVFWDGTNKNGEQLPDGTYFYVLKIGDATPFTGWIFIRGKK